MSSAVSAVAHVELQCIDKQFSGVQALRNVDLRIEAGSVHGLVGENGAGKSTLGKIIGGNVRPDGGDLLVEGRPVRYRTPRDAIADGIVLIQQELELVPHLTVAQNVLLGVESVSQGFVRRRRMRARFDELNAKYGFNLPRDVEVTRLKVADRQKVEILRAISRDARLIVMDEPTSALTIDESENLHSVVRELSAGGTTIVYVSHLLEEVLELTDTVTVLRNGFVVKTSASRDENVHSLVAAMLGEEATLAFPPKEPAAPDAPVVLSVRGLTREGALDGISFDIRAGEILGLAGLVGSGRSEVARAIFGADRLDEGTIELDGERLKIRSPGAASRAGIALVPENRKEEGLVLGLSLGRNVTLPHLASITTAGWVSAREESRTTSALLERLRVVPPRPAVVTGNLSGGNQQKVLFAKWLYQEPRVILLDEPTRGVDVGARRAIFELICNLARRGLAVLLISSELEEVMGLAHRVLVMRLGKIVDEFETASLSIDAIMHAAFGLDLPELEAATTDE